MDAIDREIIRLTQAGLPLVEQPYQQLAEQLGISAGQLMARMQHMQDQGIIRRNGT